MKTSLFSTEPNFSLSSKERTYAVATYIPKGKIVTYKILAQLAFVTNPRLVGNYLHNNPYPGIIPCHRVVSSQGKVAHTFAFGGEDVQREMLVNEGIEFRNGKLAVSQYLWYPNQIMQLYWHLLFLYGYPGEWPWFGQDVPHSPDEITLGAILTQNTNWKNVTSALRNLRHHNLCSISAVGKLSSSDFEELENLIKPSGYYRQKALYLYGFCKHIVELGDLSALFALEVCKARKLLLSIKGIGKETADTILLYAGKKPVFVIDTYTKRFCKHFNISNNSNYDYLQDLFTKHLPQNYELYQDYHALIVRWGKAKKFQNGVK